MKICIHSLYFCETKAMSQLSPLSMMLNWNSENTVRRFASQVDFKYNQDILNDLTQFVEVSLSYDVRNAVLGNMTMSLGEKNLY